MNHAAGRFTALCNTSLVILAALIQYGCLIRDMGSGSNNDSTVANQPPFACLFTAVLTTNGLQSFQPHNATFVFLFKTNAHYLSSYFSHM
jgi:hypothetical protein